MKGEFVMNLHRHASAALAMLICLSLASAAAADTPDRVNYQGVLRDAAGVPRNGTFDMTFRFFDAPVGPREILVDAHLASGTGAVPVDDGLFDVWLGTGVVSDGVDVVPGDPYTSLAEMFGSFPETWLEIQIGGEILAPRVLINSVPYALHAQSSMFAEEAGSLGGLPPGSFLDTSTTAQTKSGPLRVDGALTAGGNQLRFLAPGAAVSASDTALVLEAGDQPTDDLVLRAGLSADGGSGMIQIEGESQMTLWSGNGRFQFMNGATMSGTGVLTETGAFVARDFVAENGSLNFIPSGAIVGPTASNLTIGAGYDDTDDLFLRAGNDSTDGSIDIFGDGLMTLRSGNGLFNFVNGTTGVVNASIDSTGTLNVQNDLVATGNELRFGAAGARVFAAPTALQLIAGDADGDDLLLTAGNELTDGSIDIFGDNQITFRAGNGSFGFVDGSTSASVATIRSSATMGYELHLGPIGSTRIVRNPSNDDLYFARDEDQNTISSTFSIFTNLGIQQMRINDEDEAPAFFDGAVNVNGIDYAEAFSITDPTLEAGEVVVFDPARAGYVSRATGAYSTLLAGVISERPGFVTGSSFDAEEAADPELAEEMRAAYAAKDYDRGKEISLILEAKKREQQRPVALAGRLPVKVDATYGAIHAGDPLTSSSTPGYAMAMREAGPSIGVALESFAGPGTGVVLAFVQRGHFTPPSMLTETIAAQEELARTVDARTPDPASGMQVLPSNLQLVLDGSGDQDSRFSIFRDGTAAEPRAEVFRVDERGNVWAQGAFRPRSMDLAETFAVSETVEPGDVLVVDRESKGHYARSRRTADTGVIGVVATDPGVLLGGDVSRVLDESPELSLSLAEARAALDHEVERAVWSELERRFRASYAAVALSGTVPVKVDAGYGAIMPGDLLVSSPTPGHAMRAPDPAPAGAVIGKALELLEAGTGKIRMIVVLR